MALPFIKLLPIILVFVLYFLGMPIVYALFGSTYFFFLRDRLHLIKSKAPEEQDQIEEGGAY